MTCSGYFGRFLLKELTEMGINLALSSYDLAEPKMCMKDVG